MRERLEEVKSGKARELLSLIDQLVRRSVWIIGGDGWAYDIGSSGLDHVLASGRDVNVLVMDTEVYSNTGGQMSKSTPLGAVAKFAAGGKTLAKKDVALQAISYGNVYVARIAFGANPQQALQALREAEAYPGPSLIIAYSHCIAHGIDMEQGLAQQKRAVDSGHWPLMRYNPVLRSAGQNPSASTACAPPSRSPNIGRRRPVIGCWPRAIRKRPAADAGGATSGVAEVGHLRGDGHPRGQPFPSAGVIMG